VICGFFIVNKFAVYTVDLDVQLSA